MASSRLYNDALAAFKTQMLQELKSSKEQELLENFLATREVPQQAAEQAKSLKLQTDKKWSDRKVGKVTVPAHWIDKIMENIQYFITVGNFVMEGAPESAGLAWLAVRLTLSAIQGNYELYSLFGTGLTDITEIMVLIPHYDKLYDDGSKNLRKGESLVGILFSNITEAYIAVLRFSFEIKRHISASPLTKVTHVVADLFGASKLKFQDLIDKIKTRKSRVLEYSMAAYQDKSLKFNERHEADMKALKNTLEDMQNFHDSEKKYREEFIAEMHAVKQSFEATTKPKTHWDIAISNFEKTKKKLSPKEGTQEPLTTALSRRFSGTCQWILEDSDFLKWHQAQSNELLWVTGGKGAGKSTLLGFVIENLCESMDKDNTIPIYFSCETSANARTICNTLLYQVYTQARNENDVSLLEDCNAVFSHSKSAELTSVKGNEHTAQARGGIAHIIGNDDPLAEFAVAMPKLATVLKRSIVVIIDAVDSLQADDQKYLVDQIRTALTTADETESSKFHIKILVGCRVPLKSTNLELNVENRNYDDMKIRLSAALKSLQGISSEELEKATNMILKKAGSSFSYITEIGIPFIRQPFQGPFDKRLELLPEPREMSNTYNEAIQKMEPNYLELLRVAVTWCLLAPTPRALTVEVVIDVFRGTYQTKDLGDEKPTHELDGTSFPLASHLEKGQLEETQGPFLDLELSDDNPSFVSLRNYNQVRDFCIESATSQHSHDRPGNDERYICSRCGISASEPKDLIVSEKESHLDIALVSLRHLNNPLFQKRAQLLCDETSMATEQNVETEPDKSHEQPVEDDVLKESGTDQAEDTKQEAITTADVDSSMIDVIGNDTSNDKSTEKDGAITKDESGEGQGGVTEEDGNDTASDGSMDSEDNEGDEPVSGNEEDNEPVPEFSSRYEIHHWAHHLRKAEDLWSEDERAGNDKWEDVLTQLDRFCENTAVFNVWQNVYSHGEPSDYLKSPRRPLHVASYLGLTSWAKRLLDQKHDPNELSGSLNALQAATLSTPRTQMLKLLLERGGDINAESEDSGDGRPAFYSWLLQDASVETIKLMFEHGANPLARDKHLEYTALHYFAWTGEDPDALSLILKHPSVETDPNYINSRGRDQETPLHVLSWRKEIPTELLKIFLDHGSNVNVDDCYSRRPLQLASIWGELECLEILLRDTELIDDEDDFGNTSLHYAAEFGHAKCVDLLISKDANMNHPNKAGQTPIHEAAWASKQDCIQKLMEHGADISSLDKHDRNLLFYACQGNSQETAVFVLDSLLEKKVAISEINKVTKGLRTPLRQAASGGYEQVVRKLIAAAKANDDMVSLKLDQADARHGMTALHRAAWNGYDQCVEALLQAGADPKIPVKDENAKTALVLAYEKWALSHQSSFEDTIFHLIEKDPEAAKDDAELLSLCAANGSIRIIGQLQAIGADFSLRDQYGWTPLELARKYQRIDVEQLLKKQIAWKGLLPSRWNRSDLKDTISEDGLKIAYTNERRICVTTDRPLPAGLDDFYFEITHELLETQHKTDYPEFAIGFCTLHGHTIEFPGWPPEDRAKSAASWAYHSDNGGFYCSTGDGLPTFADSNYRYRTGDTVGCGVDLTMGKIWFTKNGELLKHSYRDVHGRLFPVVGLRHSVRFTTNFVGPFKWNSDAEHDEHKADAAPSTAGNPPNTSE